MNELLKMDGNIKASDQQNDVKTMSCNDALTYSRYVFRYEVRYDIRYVDKQKKGPCLQREGVLPVW